MNNIVDKARERIAAKQMIASERKNGAVKLASVDGKNISYTPEGVFSILSRGVDENKQPVENVVEYADAQHPVVSAKEVGLTFYSRHMSQESIDAAKTYAETHKGLVSGFNGRVREVRNRKANVQGA